MSTRLGSIVATALVTVTFTGTAAGAAPLPTAVNAPAAVSASLPTAVARPSVADVGHRGASAYAPENTIASFKLAAKKHANLFELDVQETKDHKLVILHDTTLSRTTNVESVYPGRSPYNVRSFTLAQVKKLDAGSWFSKKYKGERVPTLDETLKKLRSSGLGLLLEAKKPELYPGIGKRIAATLRANPYWLAPDASKRRLIVQSFNWGFIKSFHGILRDVPTGLLGTPSTGELSKVAKYADYVNPPYEDASKSYIGKVHRAHLKLYAWTVNDSPTMRRLIKLGVDGIITNKPDVLYNAG